MRADRRRLAPHVLWAIAVLLGCGALDGCGRRAGPPPIGLGASCAGCGMATQDLRFACERDAGDRWRVYDSIECLLRDVGPGEAAWLADYDSRTLHRSDSMWVVHGSFPSPMGGGYAAFLDRAAADEIAAESHGRVGRLAEFAAIGEER